MPRPEEIALNEPEFDFDFGSDPLPDLHAILREIRETTRFARARFYGQPATLITRYDDVRAAFRDDEAFPSRAFQEPNTVPVTGPNLLSMTGQEHRVKRRLIAQTLKPSAVRTMKQSLFSEVAHALVDDFEGKGSADLVHDFTARFSFTIMSRLLGIPSAYHDKLHGWVQDFFGYAQNPERALRAKREFDAILLAEIESRRGAPQDDVLTELIEVEVEGTRLSDGEILGFVKLLFPAGSDTTYLANGNLLHALLARPETLRRVRDVPADRAKAIEEVLRWDPPVTLQPRINPKTIEWRGHRVDAGSMLFGVSCANRDPAYFDEGDVFDIDRICPIPPLTFGNGLHYCVGSHFARSVMATALDVILDRLPAVRLEADPGVQVQGGSLRGPNRLPVTF